MIDTFTREQFEQVLTDAQLKFDDLGWIADERVYALDLGHGVTIRIRSSIHHDGVSADVGKDSIRVNLMLNGQPLASKEVTQQARWIGRMHGWPERLISEIDKLRLFYSITGLCVCGSPRVARVAGRNAKPQNIGKTFTTCPACGRFGSFINLDRIESQNVLPLPRTDSPTPSEPKQKTENGGAGESVLSSGKPVDVSTLMDLANEESAPAPVIVKEFKPSKYQSAAYDWIQNGSGNGLMIAVPGSGKTTTLVTGVSYIPTSAKAIYLAFAKRDAEDAAKKFPEHIQARTTHSLAFSNAKRVYPKFQLDKDDRKLWDIQNQMYPREDVREFGATVKRLIGYCENRLIDPTPENLTLLCDRYNVEVNGDSNKVFEMTAETFSKNLADMSRLGFDDLLYLSATGRTPCEQFDFINLDESQDQNPAQIAMLLKSIRPGGRVLAVGDPNQSCYGFRGADTDAMDNLDKALQPTKLPLSICYRCPKTSIRLAQSLVPQMEWREDAPEGILDNVNATWFNKVQPGDLIICRVNAPLVRPCYDLIARGIKAAIRGRDIGAGLWQLVEKVAKRSESNQINTVLYELENHVRAESSKLMATGKESRAQDLYDKLETILALSEGCTRLQGDNETGLKEKIESIFSDKQAAITFSSIHRAKGDESDRVFILRPDLLPHPIAKQAWEQQQERNLQVIAWTRNKQELHFVNT